MSSPENTDDNPDGYPDAPVDAPVDAAPDAPTDAAPTAPADTAGGADVLGELAWSPAQSDWSSASGADDLRAAVGVLDSPGPADGARLESADADASDEPAESSGPGRSGMSRRTLIALLAAVGFAIVVLVFWLAGRHNSASYYVHCGDSHITAAQGRSFPPWGESELAGGKWAPIANILELSQCDDEVFDSRDALAERYRDILLGQVDTWLDQLGPDDSRERLATIRAQLVQAELLSRNSGESHKRARERIGRLLGDVAYWQAQDELIVARQHLQDAAEQLREAAEKKPVHVRDASEWRKFLLFSSDELAAGPPVLRPPAPSPKPAPGDAQADSSDSAPARDPAATVEGSRAGSDGEPAAASTDNAAPPEPGSAPRPAVPNPPPPSSGTLL